MWWPSVIPSLPARSIFVPNFKDRVSGIPGSPNPTQIRITPVTCVQNHLSSLTKLWINLSSFSWLQQSQNVCSPLNDNQSISYQLCIKDIKQFMIFFLVWRRARQGYSQTSSKTSQGGGWGLQPSQPSWICLCFPTKFAPWLYHYFCYIESPV